jgi:hypothetical protein
MKPLVALAGLLLFVLQASGSSGPQISALVGDWSGTSLCQVKPSPCHDENVIFRVSNPHQDKITIQADKIVDGKEVTLGVNDWTYDQSTGALTWHIPRGDWELIVDDNTMEGTLVGPDNVVFRKIHLKKSR